MSARARSIRTVMATLVVSLLAVGALAGPAQAIEFPTGPPLSGTVTAGGSPVAGAMVFIVASGIGSSTTTDGSGGYSFSATPDVDLRIYVAPQRLSVNTWAPTWYGDTAFRSEATVVTTDGARSGLDIALLPAQTISGTVSVTGAPDSAGVMAFLYNPATQSYEDSLLGEYNSPWYTTTDANGDYTLRNLAPGQYLLRFGDIGDKFGLKAQYWPGVSTIDAATLVTIGGADLVDHDVTLQVGGPAIERLAGADRFEAAISISQAGFPDGADSVFIVNGLNFPDALSAGPAAVVSEAPVLLVTPTSIPDAVYEELERLDPQSIVIVGGPASVSEAVAAQLVDFTGDAELVTRLAGADRFEASRNVAEQLWGTSQPSTVYIATGTKFPDALGAGAAAGADGAPLLLVNGAAAELDAATADLIESLAPSRVVIVGGEASVSVGIAEDIRAIDSVTTVSRHSGKDRFRAAANLGSEFPVTDTVYLATGLNFPDALAGAALAGGQDAPVYLVQKDCVSFFVLLELGRLNPERVVILGGTASVGAGAANLTSCGDQDGA